MTESSKSSCCSKGRCRCCGIIFAVAHIAILTCLSMAMWKAASALEALVKQGAAT